MDRITTRPSTVIPVLDRHSIKFLRRTLPMFGRAQETPYDLRFGLFGIPVRVHPVFWLTSAIISWGMSKVHGVVRPDLLVISVLVVFISVLVHEVGHAAIARIYGFPSEIVLYFFGGYATVTQRSTWKNIATLIAGPLAGFFLFGLFLGLWGWIEFGKPLANMSPIWSDRINHVVFVGLFANAAWNLFNLIPVMPMDGGQICRELCVWISGPRNERRGLKWAIMIGMFVSGTLLVYGLVCMKARVGYFLVLDPFMPTLYFGYMCYQNYQMLQAVDRGYR